jgi:regulator of protease activity HflC (stomatin/prohibitin superfamily)
MELLLPLLLAAVAYSFVSLRVIRQYERGVSFFLGRFWGTKGPGLIFLPAGFASQKRVSLRIVAMDIPPQDVITRDNVSVKVNAVLYMRVTDPAKAIIEIEDYLYATSQLAQTTLRSVLGEVELDELLSDREKINAVLKRIIDTRTDPWGIEVSAVEVKDVDLPDQMKRAMARQAEAERERRAKVIAAQGELQASETLAQAARNLATEPSAIQLRYLQTVAEIAAENSSVTIFPIPIELFRPFIKAATGTATLAPSQIKAEGSPALPP